ncbi:hypothetical protein QUA43_30040 [Microcoleus sp. N9_B4]|uniref:hypothetical protein n=1 Tax=Microcoleus sp. N9_B4 TaxID=3055386 RepID=UPI002FD33D6E
MENIKFVGIEELDRLIDGLSSEDKEELASRLFKSLSTEARSRVMGLTDTGLTVVTGSFVSLNSDIAINIQNSNSSTLDVEAIFNALLEHKRNKQARH